MVSEWSGRVEADLDALDQNASFTGTTRKPLIHVSGRFTCPPS